MRNIYLKDMVGKLLNQGDYCIWGSLRQGYGLRLVKVDRFTPQMVYVQVIGETRNGSDRVTRVLPHHLMVVTDQLIANENNGTAVDLDIPAQGRDINVGTMQAGQSAQSWFTARGVTVDEFLQVLGGESDS
ncbi:hypothetical protein [Vibrio phage vB_VpaP_SJSY21]|nr:hypothetical protein [Vibrio phage vB_VpaP_SJSY21]